MLVSIQQSIHVVEGACWSLNSGERLKKPIFNLSVWDKLNIQNDTKTSMCCWTWLNDTPIIAKPTHSAPDEDNSRCTEQASWDLSWKRWKKGCHCCHVAFKWEPPWGSWRALINLPSLQFPKQYSNQQVLGAGSWIFSFPLEVSPLRDQKNQDSGIREGNWKPKASDKAW